MNDEQFERDTEALRHRGYVSFVEAVRARDTAQREALARVEAEHEANRLELGEALILIGQVLDCRTLEDLNPVRRYLNEFVDRHSLRPVPDVDLVQAEQQGAQGAQAGDEREAFDKWRNTQADSLRRSGYPDGAQAFLNLGSVQWAGWQARAALATQPAAGEPEQQTAINADDLPTKKYPLGAFDFDAPVAAGEPVAYGPAPAQLEREFERYCGTGMVQNKASEYYSTPLYISPPAAAHGDEAEPSVAFAAWLIDHREGRVVTEEDMHEWLGEWYENRLAMRAQAGEGGE